MRFVGISWLVVLGLVGCDCGSPPSGCRLPSDCDPGWTCVDRRCVVSPDVGGSDARASDATRLDTRTPVLTGLRLDPPMAELVSVDGSMPTQAFRALAVYSDGTETPARLPIFRFASATIASVDEAGGLLTASGLVAGTAELTVEADGRTATADVRVRIERTLMSDGLSPAERAAFDAVPATPDARAVVVRYPLDGAVMPQNVYPADVQWTGATTGDVLRVRLEKAEVRIDAFVRYDATSHWLVDATAWRSIAQSSPDEAMTVRVARLPLGASTAIDSAPVRVTFARAALTGSVYYWDIEAGRIFRIDDGTATRTSIMPTPPRPTTGENCVGCHAVSPSGRYMAGRMGPGDNIGAVFDLTTDLTGNPAATLWPTNPVAPYSARWWFSSWSPDESRLVVSFEEPGGTMRFLNPHTGDFVPVTSATPLSTSMTHPAWSPDGSSIAYVDNVRGSAGWGGDYTSGDISVIPVTGPDALGSPTRIHVGSSLPGGSCDGYPTWTPTSTHLAFHHGSDGRSETGSASLYVMSATGAGVRRLDRAMGSAASTDSFQPRFSPFNQGGYFWLSFLSRRDYGNSATGTAGRAFQQIWVTAISQAALAGTEDPSSVPYWVPGQSVRSRNIAAYWAPRPCRRDGESCGVASECCGGVCAAPPGGGAPVCSPPPPDRCRRPMETCTSDEDCCPGLGLSCYLNVCTAGPG